MEKRICIFWLGHKKASGGAVVEAYDLDEACGKVRWNKADVIVKKVRVLTLEEAVERANQAQAELERILKGGKQQCQ